MFFSGRNHFRGFECRISDLDCGKFGRFGVVIDYRHKTFLVLACADRWILPESLRMAATHFPFCFQASRRRWRSWRSRDRKWFRIS